MKRLLSIIGGGLGVLVIIGLAAVLIFSLSSIKRTTDAPITSPASSLPAQTQPEPGPAVAATATRDPGVFQSPLPAPVEPVLPTPIGIIQPPLCKFEDKASPQPEQPSALDKFVFSEPKVIFSQEAPIEIIEWLPDNQNLLVHIRNQTKQSIETLDTTTGQTEVYADNLQSANQVHWISTENAVAYTEDKTPQFSGVDQFGLWLSRGKGEAPQLLLEAEYDELLRSSGNAGKLSPEIARAFNMYDFPFDPELWRYNKYPQDPYYLQSWSEIKFASSVSPDGSKAVFYRVPWLYLVDLKTNQPCEVDLGQTYNSEQGPLRVFNAKWSPDGKLLAMQTAVGYRGQNMYSNKLVILNTITGEIYRPEIKWSYILDIEWFPDSRYLVVMGQSTETEQPYPHQHQQIGIVDSLTQQSRLMLPNYVFGGASQSGFQLALSPNGKNLTISCRITSDKSPLVLKDQVCFIPIN
jgi:hypothetical protein